MTYYGFVQALRDVGNGTDCDPEIAPTLVGLGYATVIDAEHGLALTDDGRAKLTEINETSARELKGLAALAGVLFAKGRPQ